VQRSTETDIVINIGDNDLDLAKRLIKAGSEHCKFLRQINVYMDVNLPRYIWQELDTYHFGTKNSCSTMHRLFNKKEKITLDLFYIPNENVKTVLIPIIDSLNAIREEYLRTKDNELLRTAKCILPESYLQLRTWSTNYQELRNIYHQRKNHRMNKEWKILLNAIETLPYAKELIIE